MFVLNVRSIENKFCCLPLFILCAFHSTVLLISEDNEIIPACYSPLFVFLLQTNYKFLTINMRDPVCYVECTSSLIPFMLTADHYMTI